MKLGKIVFSTLAVALLAAGCNAKYNSVYTGNSSPIKIGAVLPLTGWGAYWAEGEQKGIVLAEEDIRSVGGSIQVVVEDGQTDAKQSATAAEKLISVNKVGGMFVEFTGPASSVSPIARQHGVVLLYDALTRKPLGANPYALKMYYDAEKQCAEVAKYLVSKGYKHIGGVMLTLDFVPECKKGIESVTREISDRSTAYYEVAVDTTDFRTTLAKINADKVDAVITMMYEDNAVAFFKQRAELGLTFAVATGTGKADNFTEKVIQSVPAASLEGVYTYGHDPRDWFVQKIKARFLDITDKELISAAYGYDQTQYIYQALKACSGSAEVSCTVQSILNNRTYQSALPASGFTADRVLAIQPTYYIFHNGKLAPVSQK